MCDKIHYRVCDRIHMKVSERVNKGVCDGIHGRVWRVSGRAPFRSEASLI